MPSIQEIYEKLCLWAPPETQMDFDNSGFLLGHGERAVTRVLLSLDITASGGVSSLEDVTALRELGLYAAIIGKAYYTGAVDLSAAVEAAR